MKNNYGVFIIRKLGYSRGIFIISIIAFLIAITKEAIGGIYSLLIVLGIATSLATIWCYFYGLWMVFMLSFTDLSKASPKDSGGYVVVSIILYFSINCIFILLLRFIYRGIIGHWAKTRLEQKLLYPSKTKDK